MIGVRLMIAFVCGMPMQFGLDNRLDEWVKENSHFVLGYLIEF